MTGGLPAPGASANAAPCRAETLRARRADAWRPSPLPVGRWWPAVTRRPAPASHVKQRLTVDGHAGYGLYSTKVQQPPPHTATFYGHQHARQSGIFERAQQRASSYGSEGWGFESLRARHISAGRGRFSRVRGGPFRCREAGPLTISHSLLGDLVNAGEGSAALLKVRVARVDVGALGERGVVVACPFADDGDRHARVLHQRQGCVPGGV